MMISTLNLSKNYGKRPIFQDFSYEFPTTGVVAIVGPSGTGKSTLLNLISGIDFDYTGNITVDGKNLKKLSESELANFRLEKIGYVFQNFNLMNLDTVFNNVFLPIDTISGAKNVIKKQRVHDALKLVGLNHLSNKRINKLSGGEKQRTAIARSIINDPSIILCDEPTGALDEKNSEEVFNLLATIGKTKLVIVATHDLDGIKKIANKILEIKDEKFVEIENTPNEIDEAPLLIGIGQKKQKQNVSIKFKLRHAWQKMKAKKFRSLILNVMLSLSLTGVGLSLIISESVSTKVNDAFKAILNGNQIVMSLKNENQNSFTNYYNTNFKKVYEIADKYDYLLDGIGVNYLVNFEDFFKDGNEFFVSSTNKKIYLDSISARNINEFKWFDGNSESIMYPFSAEFLDDDQIVLGLSEADMINLCFQLQIQRNFTSLGHYIYEKGLMVTLKVKNNFWEYEDEQLFNVVAVCQSNFSSIYHSNLLWNEQVFEEMMRLPSDDDTEHYYPWEMEKIYYLKTKNDPSQFLDASLYDDSLDNFVFERTNFNYNPSLCKYGSVCDEKRVYIYSVDKNCVSPKIINDFKNKIDLNSYHFITDYGYASYASNLFSGFSKNVFVSENEDFVDMAIDADTQLNNETNLAIDLPPGVVQGNFLNSLADGLRFSSNYGKLLYGRKPVNLNEIVISKGLAETLDSETLCLGKYLSFAGEISEYYDENGNILKEYNKAKILVVGITDETKNYVYHNPNWSISFFRDKLGVSNFFLIPKAVVFEFENEGLANEALKVFEESTFDYKFVNPMDELNSNVNSTLDYANTILLAFSVLSTVISVLLLGTVLMLDIIESKGEVQMFKYLGIKSKDINSCFVFQGLLQGLVAFFFSAFELIAVDFIISYFLGDYLNIGFKFNFNPKPTLIIFLMGTLIPIIISKTMLFFMNKSKKR